ncbi:DUF2255 family protein [Deinococcus roseus]|uniref:DUF2255 domain-containing protein n=1 Tax=Deinococcus roseus TaxID=392414 RepID=A0ABQ2DHH2_9DEIO|nr:DUF2255 family protein [Deinococcus roseus]GGJ57464.1 hypothetical protein GCM10008938_49390 [Deinococcus roseus]
MTHWPAAELQSITEKDDLQVAPHRDDGVTYGTPTWIWNVQVDGQLYVRAYHGIRSRWYQAALKHKTGRIQAANRTHEVIFEPVEDILQDKIDTAYRLKYQGDPYLSSMLRPQARQATVRILPRVNAP